MSIPHYTRMKCCRLPGCTNYYPDSENPIFFAEMRKIFPFPEFLYYKKCFNRVMPNRLFFGTPFKD
jgi:hypothetical protein